VLRERGENAAWQAAAAMRKGMVIDLTPPLAIAAAALSLRHDLPMADSLILATAQAHDAVLWTQDEHFKGLPRVKYYAKK
ncbi:MAG: PIN domain-containing protein, partial [bacterium]|nr:PIN domain-containing protein [bacterium]